MILVHEWQNRCRKLGIRILSCVWGHGVLPPGYAPDLLYKRHCCSLYVCVMPNAFIIFILHNFAVNRPTLLCLGPLYCKLPSQACVRELHGNGNGRNPLFPAGMVTYSTDFPRERDWFMRKYRWNGIEFCGCFVMSRLICIIQRDSTLGLLRHLLLNIINEYMEEK